jgi:hypothetical protein
MRKYKYDEDYFSYIDTPNKAYFLGLWYADGCVMNLKRGKLISMGLQARDKLILEKFLKEIRSPHKLVFIKSRSIDRQDKYSIQLHSNRMADDLIKLGCVPNKTRILTFPKDTQVPDELLSHFIRGVFDGDGSISSYIAGRNINPQFRVSICGTKDMCEGIANIFHKVIGLPNRKVRIKNGKYGECAEIDYRGNRVIRKIFDFFYKDSETYLNRKYIKMSEVNNLIPNSNVYGKDKLGRFIKAPKEAPVSESLS